MASLKKDMESVRLLNLERQGEQGAPATANLRVAALRTGFGGAGPGAVPQSPSDSIHSPVARFHWGLLVVYTRALSQVSNALLKRRKRSRHASPGTLCLEEGRSEEPLTHQKAGGAQLSGFSPNEAKLQVSPSHSRHMLTNACTNAGEGHSA